MSENVFLHKKEPDNENEVKTLKSYQRLSSFPVFFLLKSTSLAGFSCYNAMH